MSAARTRVAGGGGTARADRLSGDTPRAIRCAIYTRKSSEEGLEQEFNSLDAQREACEAYILSQRHEGWRVLPDRYDDGGFSGGTMERPGLVRLLAEIEAGRIDTVVVYKVDRLTRSLADFAKIVERFDGTGISFVSVTQQFNTTSSMGRLTLNVLLSFAQFEREVTGERIRDKIAASKRKGLWMGGNVPFGYRNEGRSLVIVEEEATIIRHLFQLYLQLGTVNEVRHAARRLGYRTRQRELSDGRTIGGGPFANGPLYHLLQNPIYRGMIRHRHELYAGVHEPIISEQIWDEVQAQFTRNTVDRKAGHNAQESSLLAGMISTSDGHRLTPSHATKTGKRYRYYVSTEQQRKPVRSGKHKNKRSWRVPAQEIERAVLVGLRQYLEDQGRLLDSLRPRSTAQTQQMLAAAEELGGHLSRAMLLQLGLQVQLAEDGLELTLDAQALKLQLGMYADHGDQTDVIEHGAVTSKPELVRLSLPMRIRQRGVEMKLVLGAGVPQPAAKPDATLIRAIARGRRWFSLIRDEQRPLNELAKEEQLSPRYIARHLRLAFLAPKIIKAILDGRQPPTLTLEMLRKVELPLCWEAQEKLIGFD